MEENVTPIVEPDPVDMLRQLEHIFGGFLDGHHNGLIELCYTSTKPDAAGRYRLDHGKLFGTDALEDMVAEAVKLNRIPQCNTYFGAALRKHDTPPFGRCTDADYLCTSAVYADFDDEGAAEKAIELYTNLKTKPTLALITGTYPHYRAQLYWRLTEPIIDPDRHRALITAIATQLGGDVSVSNPSRVMRLAGSIAWPVKQGRVRENTYLTPITQPDMLQYTVEHLERVFHVEHGNIKAEDPRAPEYKPKSTTLGGLGRLDDGREEYMRDTIMACLSEFVREHKRAPTVDELFAIVWPQYSQNVNLDRPGRGAEECMAKCRYAINRYHAGRIHIDPDVAPDDAERRKSSTGNSSDEYSFTGAGQAPPQQPPPPIDLNFAPLMPIDPKTIPVRPWIIHGVLLRQHTTVIVAPGGVGKSLLTAQMALALAAGQSWGTFTVDRSYKSVLINSEDDFDEMRRRTVAACAVMGLDDKIIGDKVLVAMAPESIVVARTVHKTKVVNPTAIVEPLIKYLIDNQIDVVIADPFAETFEGDENSNSEVKWAAAIWRSIARRANCAVVLVHHTKKYAADMAGDSDASRGAGALVNSSRICQTLFLMSDKEAETFGVDPNDRWKYIRLDDAKANLTLITRIARWFEKESQSIGNGSGLQASDMVGVLKPYTPPSMWSQIDWATIIAILDTLRGGILDPTGKPTGWLYEFSKGKGANKVTTVIATAAGIDDKQAKKVVKEWLDDGVLTVQKFKDKYRKDKDGAAVPDTAYDEMVRAAASS